MGWETSTRKARLPKDWHRRRAIAKREANGQCQWLDDTAQRCTAPGTDCDHIDRHGGDGQANLQWLCTTHHRAKTTAEGTAALPRERRPTPQHPGLA